MKGINKVCLSCKFFRLQNTETGICRFEKMAVADYPIKHMDGQCDKWRDSGQQYFIRLGWIKAQKAETAG